MRNTSLLFGLHEWNICVREHRKVFVVGSIKERVWELCMTGAIIEKLKIYFSFLKVFKHKHSVCVSILSMLVKGNFHYQFWQKSCETSKNVNSLDTICVKREIRDWWFSPFFVILSEKLVNFCVISRQNAKIMWIGCEWEFTT